MRFHFWDVGIGLHYNAFDSLVILLHSSKELFINLLERKQNMALTPNQFTRAEKSQTSKLKLTSAFWVCCLHFSFSFCIFSSKCLVPLLVSSINFTTSSRFSWILSYCLRKENIALSKTLHAQVHFLLGMHNKLSTISVLANILWIISSVWTTSAALFAAVSEKCILISIYCISANISVLITNVKMIGYRYRRIPTFQLQHVKSCLTNTKTNLFLN